MVDQVQRSVDHFAAEDVNFACFTNVADAFAELLRIFTEKLHGAKFETIRAICLTHANKQLRNEISRTTSIHNLFALLACNPLYFNWMNVDYLQTIAVASGNRDLQEMLKSYTDVVLSKTLGEVWNVIPSFHKTKTKYYSKVRARFHGKNPDKITVKDLKKYEPRFAKKIALHIMQINKGSLTITWCIFAEQTYQVYLLALSIPQELREDDFLQIGTWIAYPSQSVIQELKRVHSEFIMHYVNAYVIFSYIFCTTFPAMMTTTTLLVGYYRGLLLKVIDFDLLKDKMYSLGLLTANEQVIISSGYSVYQKNWLLLNQVQQMDVQAFLTFCKLVQEIWPQIGSQLISGTYVLLIKQCICPK